jgi:putative hemolysin
MNNPKKQRYSFITISLLMIILVGCISTIEEPTPTPYDEYEADDQFVGMPNQASFYCQEMGYELDIRDTDSGQEGICVFPDGQECEQWTFLTGSCSIEWTFCQRQGGRIQAGESIGTCIFEDGSTCPEYDYFIDECQAPE